MKRFLVLPTQWDITSDEDTDNAERLNIPCKTILEDGFIEVDPDMIAFRNAISDNLCRIGINGGSYNISMSLPQLKEKMNEFYYSKSNTLVGM